MTTRQNPPADEDHMIFNLIYLIFIESGMIQSQEQLLNGPCCKIVHSTYSTIYSIYDIFSL